MARTKNVATRMITTQSKSLAFAPGFSAVSKRSPMIFGKTKPNPLEIKVVTTATASAQRYGLVKAYKRRNCEKSRGLTGLFGSLLGFSGRRNAGFMPSDYACDRLQARAKAQSPFTREPRCQHLAFGWQLEQQELNHLERLPVWFCESSDKF